MIKGYSEVSPRWIDTLEMRGTSLNTEASLKKAAAQLYRECYISTEISDLVIYAMREVDEEESARPDRDRS